MPHGTFARSCPRFSKLASYETNGCDIRLGETMAGNVPLACLGMPNKRLRNACSPGIDCHHFVCPAQKRRQATMRRERPPVKVDAWSSQREQDFPPMPRDPYEVLGVTRTATQDDIKKSYRKLAREYHPDRNPGDKVAEGKFKEIQEAYDILGDEQKKSQFDQFGFAGPQQNSPFGNGSPFGQGFDGAEIDLGDILGGMFGGRGRGRTRRSRAVPEPTVVEMAIPLELVHSGGKRSFRFNDKDLEITIPAGIQEEKKLKLAGQGNGGADLLVAIRYATHQFFKRDGNDLVLETPVSLPEAAVGTKVDIPTLDGARLTVKIPAGASSGQRLRLKGRGLLGGDLHIEIKIVAPVVADDKGRAIIEELASLYPQNPRSGPPWGS
ncbi:MAG: DnaJ C-terminal domain-containing protein [Planctomycetota bacterium]